MWFFKNRIYSKKLISMDEADEKFAVADPHSFHADPDPDPVLKIGSGFCGLERGIPAKNM